MESGSESATYIIVDVISNWDIWCKFSFRGFTEENTKLGIISPIGYYKSPNEDILSNWRLGHCSLTPLYLTQKFPNSNWVYYPQFNQLGMLCPVGIFNKSAHLADSVIVLRCPPLCVCLWLLETASPGGFGVLWSKNLFLIWGCDDTIF